MTPIRTRLLTVCCAVAMFAAACSSGTETATTELPTLADTTEEATTEEPTTEDAAGDAATADEADDAAGESDEEVDPEIAMAEYEQCMEDQGVSMSLAVEGGDGAAIETIETDGDDEALEFDGQNLDVEDFEAATEVCEPILEDAFGSFELSPEEEAEMADQMLELEKCLADEGFDIDMNGGNSFQIGGDDMDFEAFEEAMQTCGNDIQTIDAG